MMQHKLSALALALALLCAPFTSVLAYAAPAATLAASAVPQDDTPPDVEQAMFTRGQNFYNQGRFEQAATVFRDFLKTYPNSIITDLTLLWLGRTYIAQGRLSDAESVVTRLRTIRDTPFIEIYEGELQAARTELASRGGAAPQPTATPGVTERAQVTPPTTRTTTARATPLPTPTPTARLVARSTPPRTRPTPLPTPTPTPTQVARNTNTPTLVIENPPANTQTAGTQTNTPARRSRRSGGGRLPSRRNTAPVRNTGIDTQVATNTSPVVTPTPAATPRPTPTRTPARPTPARITPTPTPTPVQIARAEPNESVTSAPPIVNTAPGSQEGFVLTVKQVPNLNLALRTATLAASPGQVVQLPLTVTNTGNKEDQFRLGTDLPAEFQPTFSLASGGQDTGLPILVTPQLARGQNLDVLLNLRIPETAGDGQQRAFIVSAASQSDYQIQRVSNAAITVVAAALAGSSGVTRDTVQPGETFTQTISIRNSGSAPARSSRTDFVFSTDFELVSATPLPLYYDNPSRTAIWSLGDLDSRATREITVTLRALPNALSATGPIGRGMLRTASLPTASNYDGPSIAIGRVPRARIDPVSPGLTVTPGDVIFIPFVVRNPGNYAESYNLRITAPGAPSGTLYADSNGDGQHQESEPSITQTGQIDPRGGQYPLLMRVEIPRSTADRQQYAYNVVATAGSTSRAASEASTVLTVAAPRVRVRTEQVTDTTAPGDMIFYRLVLINEGGGLAKNIVVSEVFPDALQFVSSNPTLSAQDAPGDSRRLTWRVPELAPNDTAVLLITVRLRPDLVADRTLTTSHTWVYQDTNGNTYQNQ
ncbi:MAG TPA: tetratricopeptide repeat protein [Pyrinomonadaceae bacterium]|nr:tetratricopeptide repeat protein [Pyrinomonadaceae bacterium]